MEERQIKTNYLLYKGWQEMDADDRELIQHARLALEKAYAPYSDFFVGAAARLSNGAIVCGANQENAAYPMCLCAERVALGNATMQYPQAQMQAMAITIKNPKRVLSQPAAPCGSCRQALCETESRQQSPVRLLLMGMEGPVIELESAASILPLGFHGGYF